MSPEGSVSHIKATLTLVTLKNKIVYQGVPNLVARILAVSRYYVCKTCYIPPYHMGEVDPLKGSQLDAFSP